MNFPYIVYRIPHYHVLLHKAAGCVPKEVVHIKQIV